MTHALPSRFGLAKFGLHNPHFSTFGRAEILKSDRFELGIRGADIAYFIRIFAKMRKVMTTGAIATLMGEGGFSTNSYCNILRGNLQLLSVYLRHTNVLIVPFVLLIKLGSNHCRCCTTKFLNWSVPHWSHVGKGESDDGTSLCVKILYYQRILQSGF